MEVQSNSQNITFNFFFHKMGNTMNLVGHLVWFTRMWKSKFTSVTKINKM